MQMKTLLVALTLGACCPAVAGEVIAYWPFGESGLADASGNGHALTAGTGVSVGDFVTLDGTQSAFSTVEKLDLRSYDAVTVEFWARIDPSLNPSLAMLLEQGSGGVTGAICIDYNELANGIVGMWTGGNGGCGAAGGAGIADGTWHHIAFVIERNKESADASRLYIDKMYVSNTCAGFRDSLYNNPGPGEFADETLYIGSRANSSLKFTGAIDDLRISEGALKPEEFVRRNAGQVGPVVAYWPFGEFGLTDASGNGHTLEAGSGVTVDGTVKLDGTQSAFNTIETLDLSRYSAVTVEFWTKFATDDNPGVAILLEQSANAGLYPGAFSVDYNDMKSGILGAWTSANGGCAADGGKGIADGMWHHIAFVIRRTLNSDDASRLYIDGKFISNRCATYGAANKPGPVALANETLYIGSRMNDSLKFKGEIDDVRITAAALEPENFVQHVAAYWPFGASGLADASGNGPALVKGRGVRVRDAAKLDGAQASFNTSGTLDLSPYNAVTVEFWTKIDPADNPSAAIFLEHSPNANLGKGTFMLDFNELRDGVFGAWISANGGCGADGGVGIADGNWHHVAFVIERNLNTDDASRLYIDKKFVSNRCTIYPGVNKPGPVALANETLYIGSRANDSLKFKGEIDDLRVTGAALPPDAFLGSRTETFPRSSLTLSIR